MNTVSVFVGSSYPVKRRSIKQAVKEVLKSQGIKSDVELGISIIGDRKMKYLQKKFMAQDCTTDVLSFPLEDFAKSKTCFVNPPDNILHLGNIVISYPQARKQAAQNNFLIDDEIKMLVGHGLLHLLGEHHE